MRLLHTQTLQFKDFLDSNIEPYAILSHRWGDSEVTLREFNKQRDTFRSFTLFQAHYKKLQDQHTGLWKIIRCCQLAAEHGFTWVWIDTCCIDKSSSAELSEAINSMYRWYNEAGECYAYLSDIASEVTKDSAGGRAVQHLTESKWFTRGWTLQELLAPKKMFFYDQSWNYVGTREDLSHDISLATGIDVEYLQFFETHEEHFTHASVAKRMSWVSVRQTSRIEDMAYCMLGIFDVTMPLLYGEGKKAFMRLQLEIIKKNDDESIFAWKKDTSSLGMLALWPTAFADSRDVWIDETETRTEERLPYSMTNKGLEFRTMIDWWASDDNYEGTVLTIGLNCWRGQARPRAITITLRKHGKHWERIEQDSLPDEQYIHSSVRRTMAMPYGASPKLVTLYVKQAGM